MKKVALEVRYCQVFAPRQCFDATCQLLVPQRNNSDIAQSLALSKPQQQLFSDEGIVAFVSRAAIAPHTLIQSLAEKASVAAQTSSGMWSALLVVNVKVEQGRLHSGAGHAQRMMNERIMVREHRQRRPDLRRLVVALHVYNLNYFSIYRIII